jgi:hypothetical protein
MALIGPSIDEECATGVARFQRMTFKVSAYE